VYTIKRAAELTGVPVATLRAWESRYGVVTPQRTDSGYRLYDERSLAVIAAIRDLVASGWSASQAAAEVQRRQADPAPQPATDARTAVAAVAGTDVAGTAVAPADAVPALAAHTDDHPFADLVASAADLDPVRLATLLDDQFSRGSFEAVVDGWLMPALDEIGRAWADGRIGVAGEHLVAHAIGRRLSAAYDAAARDPHGASVVVGLPPGAHHELGILAFATAARRVGLATTYLGADLPARDWLTAVTRHEARCAVLSLACEHDISGLRAVAALIRKAHPRLRIAVGGRYQHLAPEGTYPLGHNIAAAATRLAQDLTD
jgi:MerR family transcriptional regulator, light-induced transcriptional regulator